LTQIKDIVPNPEQEEWASTLNIAKIETENQVFNKIPDSCSVFLDIRFIPYDDIRILTEIQAILTDDFIFSVIEHEPAICTKEDNDILVSLTGSITRV
jgi:acetylornithine deacetylase/succinyl-diaminopimelate desuccinylase-like protein